MQRTALRLGKIAALPRYRHPADLVNIYVRPVRQQNLEINGKLDFDSNLYYSANHQALLKNIIPTRQRYRSQTIEGKLPMATKEFDAWNQYLSKLVAELNQNQKIEGTLRQKVYESYLIAKQRNQERIQMSKVVRLFYELQKGFRFDIPVHPIVMMKMVHPHMGYLNNYKDTRLPFNEFCAYLEEIVAVSKLLSEGNTLHADQLLSFTFWKLHAAKPTMKMRDFKTFLEYFKFDIKGQSEEQGIKETLEYNLKGRQGQIKDGVVRFDFWRNIFLERGL